MDFDLTFGKAGFVDEDGLARVDLLVRSLAPVSDKFGSDLDIELGVGMLITERFNYLLSQLYMSNPNLIRCLQC